VRDAISAGAPSLGPASKKKKKNNPTRTRSQREEFFIEAFLEISLCGFRANDSKSKDAFGYWAPLFD
jgi:hypothetical protein